MGTVVDEALPSHPVTQSLSHSVTQSLSQSASQPVTVLCIYALLHHRVTAYGYKAALTMTEECVGVDPSVESGSEC